MALYKHTDGKLLYIGGALAHNANCCCSTCDPTTVKACCIYTTLLGITTASCTGSTTECACNALSGVTVPSCSTVNCCLNYDSCMQLTSCNCALGGGVAMSSCTTCVRPDPDPVPPPAPTGSGGNGTGGPGGTGGAGSGPCTQPHTPNAGDCVICSFGILNTSGGTLSGYYHYWTLQRYCNLLSRQTCLSLKSGNLHPTNDQYESMVAYWSMYELTCTDNTTISRYSNEIVYYQRSPDYGNTVEIYPGATYTSTCHCNC